MFTNYFMFTVFDLVENALDIVFLFIIIYRFFIS